MSTLTYLLIALSVSDILAPQANALIGFSYYHLSQKYGNSVVFLKFENILRFIIHPLSTMFTMSSSWIVTLTTLFRLIAVKYPFVARSLIDKKKALISLMAIFGFSLAFIMPLYAGLILKLKCTPDNKFAYTAFEIIEFSHIMKKVYTPLIQTMCFYLPWSLALIFWIFLIKSLRNSSKEFGIDCATTRNFSISVSTNRNFFRHDSKNESLRLNSLGDCRISHSTLRKRSYNKITLMVSILCFTNLICRVFTFSFIFEVIYNDFILDVDEVQSANRISYQNLSNSYFDYFSNATQLQPINITQNARMRFPIFFSYSLLLNNIFLCIDHSINIFIYYFTSPRFKKDLKGLFKNAVISKLRSV